MQEGTKRSFDAPEKRLLTAAALEKCIQANLLDEPFEELATFA